MYRSEAVSFIFFQSNEISERFFFFFGIRLPSFNTRRVDKSNRSRQFSMSSFVEIVRFGSSIPAALPKFVSIFDLIGSKSFSQSISAEIFYQEVISSLKQMLILVDVTIENKTILKWFKNRK